MAPEHDAPNDRESVRTLVKHGAQHAPGPPAETFAADHDLVPLLLAGSQRRGEK